MTSTNVNAQQFSGWEITTGFLTGNLFGSDTEGLDENASARLYQQQLSEAIEAAFPGAAVRVDYQNGEGVLPHGLQTRIYPPQATYQDDLRDEIASVEAIREQVFSDGLWAVEEGA